MHHHLYGFYLKKKDFNIKVRYFMTNFWWQVRTIISKLSWAKYWSHKHEPWLSLGQRGNTLNLWTYPNVLGHHYPAAKASGFGVLVTFYDSETSLSFLLLFFSTRSYEINPYLMLWISLKKDLNFRALCYYIA